MELPKRVYVHGEWFEACVFRVETTREDGSPDTVSIVRPDDVCELSQNPRDNVFHIGFVKKAMFKPTIIKGEKNG